MSYNSDSEEEHGGWYCSRAYSDSINEMYERESDSESDGEEESGGWYCSRAYSDSINEMYARDSEEEDGW